MLYIIIALGLLFLYIKYHGAKKDNETSMRSHINYTRRLMGRIIKAYNFEEISKDDYEKRLNDAWDLLTDDEKEMMYKQEVLLKNKIERKK